MSASNLDTLRRRGWLRTGIFADYGTLTLLGFVHYLRSYDQQHLASLQWLMGRFASRAGG